MGKYRIFTGYLLLLLSWADCSFPDHSSLTFHKILHFCSLLLPFPKRLGYQISSVCFGFMLHKGKSHLDHSQNSHCYEVTQSTNCLPAGFMTSKCWKANCWYWLVLFVLFRAFPSLGTKEQIQLTAATNLNIPLVLRSQRQMTYHWEQR